MVFCGFFFVILLCYVIIIVEDFLEVNTYWLKLFCGVNVRLILLFQWLYLSLIYSKIINNNTKSKTYKEKNHQLRSPTDRIRTPCISSYLSSCGPFSATTVSRHSFRIIQIYRPPSTLSSLLRLLSIWIPCRTLTWMVCQSITRIWG